MVVAVFSVRMVQVSVHQIVGVIPMKYSLVPTIGTMHVAGVVRSTLVVGRAAILMAWTVQFVFVDMISMHVVQMTVVKIIRVAIVTDSGVAAIRAVCVRVTFLFHAGFGHLSSFLRLPGRTTGMAGQELADLNAG